MTQIDEDQLTSYFEIKKFIGEKNPEKKVKFAAEVNTEPILSLHKYLSCFEFISTSYTDHQNAYSKKRFYQLNKNLTPKEKKTMGCFIFTGLLKTNDECFANKLKELFISMPLKKIQLLVS